MTPLVPLIAPERLFPADGVLMTRTVLDQVRLLGFTDINLDRVTAIFQGLMGDRIAIRHRSVGNAAVQALFLRAGYGLREQTWLYDTQDEAEALADRAIAEGKRLITPYPLRPGRFSDAVTVVPPALWRSLNSKQNLHLIVPGAHLAARQLVPTGAISSLQPPIWLKSASEMPTGVGYAVRYCPDGPALDRAAADFAALADCDLLIAEEDVAATSCWCATIVVEDDQTLFAGAVEQVFSAPGKQSASIIDPENPMPSAGQGIAIAVGEAARRLGYRGVAGMDIGLAADGRMVVFDPNFRINSSSVMALLQGAAAARSGLSTSLSVAAPSPLPFAEWAARICPAIDAGWFVPTVLLDAAFLPVAEGVSTIAGFLLAENRNAAEQRQAAFKEMLATP